MALRLALAHPYVADPPKTFPAVGRHSVFHKSYLRAVVLVLWIAYLALIAIRVVPEVPLPGVNHRALNHQSLT